MPSHDETQSQAGKCRGILERSLAETEQLLLHLGAKPLHARSLRALILKGADPWAIQPTSAGRLPRQLREDLNSLGYQAFATPPPRAHRGSDGSTKLLHELVDGHRVESVLMPHRTGASVCVSTQVGCPVGCTFCASGIAGLVRNLKAYEILEQFAYASRLQSPRHVVIMGIGEPLLNLRSVDRALQVVVHEMGLSPRRLTISTIGEPDRIQALQELDRRYSLAVSLHAATDDLRRQLVPTLKASLQETLDAAHRYALASSGRIQFEYVVLEGVNDSPEHIDRLIEQVRAIPCFVNFIPWNPVPELPYRSPSRESLEQRVRQVRAHGLVATIRQSQGAEQEAACGQLRVRAKITSPFR
jgi:23S rRNA (adenine2503-C2)-methyltransferase